MKGTSLMGQSTWETHRAMSKDREQKVRAEYDIVIGDSVQDIRIEVQLRLVGGWVLHGAPQVDADGYYHQAMTRHLEEIDIPYDILYNNP